MSSTRIRDRACDLAEVNTGEALRAARSITDPWFACQALSCVARYASDGQIEALINEAFESAARASDSYNAIAACAWPLRALVERNRTHLIDDRITSVLESVSAIAHPSGRSEALFLIFQAVKPAGEAHWLSVFNALVRESVSFEHWRQERNLSSAVLMVAKDNPELAVSVLSRLPEGKNLRKIKRLLEDGKYTVPRDFFWRRSSQS